MTRKLWVFQNLALPLSPWVFSIVVAVFFLQQPEWQFLGINTYVITMTLVAFSMGATVSRISEITPGEFDKNEIPFRALVWYSSGMAYAILFTVYDFFALKNEVHHWVWGRMADIVVIFLGAYTLTRAYTTCKALKLDTRP